MKRSAQDILDEYTAAVEAMAIQRFLLWLVEHGYRVQDRGGKAVDPRGLRTRFLADEK